MVKKSALQIMLLLKTMPVICIVLAMASCAKQNNASSNDAKGKGAGSDNIRPTNESSRVAQMGQFDVLGQIRALPYVKVNDFAVVGGDVLLPLKSTPTEKSNNLLLAGTLSQSLWPSRNIPYVFEGDFRFVSEFNQVAAEWAAKTPLRFVPRSNEPAYLIISNTPRAGLDVSSMCGYSDGIGLMNPGQPQKVFISPTCTTKYSTISHELGHAIGLWHEHQRADRDDYVTFYPENTVGGLDGNWDKISSIQNFSPYDTYSIMHYESFGGAKNGYQPVWRRKDGSLIIKNQNLSANDVLGINAMYAENRCEIVMNTCTKSAKIGKGSGRLVFSDSDAAAKADPARCQQRAKEYSDFCENDPSFQTWSTHVANGVENKSMVGYWFSPKLGCQVSITECDSGTYGSGVTLDDNYQNSASDEARCFARAKDYSDSCRKTNGTVTSLFYKAGAAGRTSKTYNAVPFGCSVTTTYSCRGDAQFSFKTFRDNYENADTNAERCLLRAKEYSDFCEAPEGKTTSAKFYDGTLRESVFVAPYPGCTLTPQNCRNASVTSGQKQYFGLTSLDGVSLDACRTKAKSIFGACANTLEDLVSGTFYGGGVVTPVTFGTVIQGCQVKIGDCPAQPKFSNARFSDNVGGASASKEVCFANARAYHATCQKNANDPVLVTFTGPQGLAEPSLEIWKEVNP